MNVVVVALISIIIPLAAIGLHLLQVSLESWTQRRHADD